MREKERGRERETSFSRLKADGNSGTPFISVFGSQPNI